MSCSVVHSRGSYLALLCLWCRPAVAPPDLISSLVIPICRGSGSKKKKNVYLGVPVMAQWLMNLTRNHEVAGSIPGLPQWVKDPALP